jgi:hypothetical protein
MSGLCIADKADRFDAARAAFHQVERAESELRRLAKYRRLTPAMKDDRQRWLDRLSEAGVVLADALKADPPGDC